MTKKQKQLFKEFIEERKGWNGCLKLDKTYLNITYYLINNITTLKNTQDLASVYDNLVINNELLTLDNVSEYDKAYLENRLNLKYNTIIKRLENNKICLLNYYVKNDLIDCRIWLDLNYNALDSELLNLLNNK